MFEAKTKSANRARRSQLKVAVGEAVRWGSGKTAGAVQAIRIIDTGRYVQSFCGDGSKIVLTISDGVGTTFIQPEDEVVTKLDGEEAEAALRQVRRNRL